MRKFLFGERQTGINIIRHVPTFKTVNTAQVGGFKEWLKDLNIGTKCPEIRRITRGNTVITMVNIKLAYE